MTRPAPYRICVVCSGNICRSPIAEVVLRAHVAAAGLEGDVVVDSAGTGDWHAGDGADHRAVRALESVGYDGRAHRARGFEQGWLGRHDLILAADRGHEQTLRRWARRTPGVDVDIRLLREFDPDAVAADTLELADPYYGQDADFERCLHEVEAAAAGVVAFVRGELGIS